MASEVLSVWISDGVLAVVEAHHLAVREEIEYCGLERGLGDALACAEDAAQWYRRIVGRLETYINEFEESAAAIYRTPERDESEALSALFEKAALGADARAKRALVRRRLADADENAALEQYEALCAGADALRAAEECYGAPHPPKSA